MTVSRFGISIEQELLDALDEFVVQNNFSNRSQAIRHLVNKNLVEHKWQCNNKVAGTITLFFDPHKRDLLNTLLAIYEEFYDEILSTQRFMLSPERCLEVVAVKGIAKRLTELSDRLIAVKGIQHGKLSMSRFD
ncbi:MAG TPA: nickel-responsive transcriptional regulator NikR [Prolixibacteraceae bacterium]|nr:nickel-responsive transcriptional regulator NikR [Prolixibacteraceae bacterium]HPR61996.1 nickel-responsive transcriptional regulator NikR [Prolixibacteraceae bacterium]